MPNENYSQLTDNLCINGQGVDDGQGQLKKYRGPKASAVPNYVVDWKMPLYRDPHLHLFLSTLISSNKAVARLANDQLSLTFSAWLGACKASLFGWKRRFSILFVHTGE